MSKSDGIIVETEEVTGYAGAWEHKPVMVKLSRRAIRQQQRAQAYEAVQAAWDEVGRQLRRQGL